MISATWRFRVGATGVALAVVLLAGCSPYGDPVSWPADESAGVPVVQWPLGEPDTSDEWVAALVDARVAITAAYNSGDFSTQHLRDLVGEEYMLKEAIDARDGANSDENMNSSGYYYYPGPEPLVVENINVTGAEAWVRVCWKDWATLRESSIDAETVRGWANDGTKAVLVLRRDPSGVIRLVDEVRGGGELNGSCVLSGVRAGFFDPAPPFGQRVWARDMIGPDGGPIPNSQGKYPDGTWMEGKPD